MIDARNWDNRGLSIAQFAAVLMYWALLVVAFCWALTAGVIRP